MKLSQECSKQIDSLASTIESLEQSYPGQTAYVQNYLSDYHDKLKKNAYFGYDLDLIASLGKIANPIRESIVNSVDERSTNSSDYILAQVEEAIQNKANGWYDREIVQRITDILKTKPESAVQLTDETLKACAECLSSISGWIAVALDKTNDNPRQTIYMYGLRGLKN